jgi:hypothetical protein
LSLSVTLCCSLLIATPRVASAGSTEPSRQVHERHLPPIAFQPANSGTNYVVEAGGLGRLCNTTGAGYFVARLNFEDGAVIERLTVYLEETNSGMMSLVRRGAESFEVLALTPVSTGTGEIEALSTSAIDSPMVNNKQGAYLLQVVLTGPGVCLHDAQVTYRLP